jgi:4-amino-4-deoxy-L-arabinose transferase-like glycosyltransferase
MTDDVPVRGTDILVLVAVSVLGGFLLAAWTLPPALAFDFAVSVLAGTVLLAFFLFIPVMGVRLFVEERRENERSE